jgi:hypothetical protein
MILLSFSRHVNLSRKKRPENGNARFRLLEVANLDFNSLMGKVGGWKALPREGFDGQLAILYAKI